MRKKFEGKEEGVPYKVILFFNKLQVCVIRNSTGFGSKVSQQEDLIRVIYTHLRSIVDDLTSVK